MDTGSKDITINITSGTVLKTVLILFFAYLIYVLRDLMLVLFTAVVIASAIEPATKWFAKFKVPRLLSVLIVYLFIALALSSVFYFLVPALLSETSQFISKVPQYVNSLDIFQSIDSIQNFNPDQSQNVISTLKGDKSLRDVLGNLSSFMTSIPGGVFSTVSAVFGGAFSFGLIVVISFYLAVQERGIENFLRVVTPIKQQDYVIDIWERTQKKIGLWMQGQIMLVVIIGLLVYLSLTILGVKHALLFAILAGMFELIPLFGPVLASIPAIAVAFIDGGLTPALTVVAVYIIIQQFENHLIYPLVVHKVVGVPSLLVILSLIVGAQLAGFLGIILAVPVATIIMEITTDIEKRKKRQIKAANGS